MHFRFAGLSVEEVVGTSDQARRECLLQWCGRLQAGPSDCLLPPTDLLRALVFAHRTNSPSFDWKTVDARAVDFERGIQRRKVILSPQLSSKAREEQAILQKQVRHVFTQMRPEIQTLFEANRLTPPDTFREAVAQGSGNNPMGIWEKWVLGKCKILYDGFGETEASEGVVAEFLEACPPFRAYVYGMLMQEYDRAIKPKNTGQRFKAGYNDLAMSSISLTATNLLLRRRRENKKNACVRL